MSNYATSIIVIEGPVTELEKFYNENKSDDESRNFDLFKFFPKPDFEGDTDQEAIWVNDTLSVDYLEAGEEEFWIQEPTKIEGMFFSPYSPPLMWIVNVSKLYPTLHFSLASTEQGNCVYYDAVIDNGVARGVEGSEKYEQFCEKWEETEWANADKAAKYVEKFLRKMKATPTMRKLFLNDIAYELEDIGNE